MNRKFKFRLGRCPNNSAAWMVLLAVACSKGEAEEDNANTKLAVKVSNVTQTHAEGPASGDFNVPVGAGRQDALPGGFASGHQNPSPCHPSNARCTGAPALANCDSCAY